MKLLHQILDIYIFPIQVDNFINLYIPIYNQLFSLDVENSNLLYIIAITQ